MVGPVSWGRGVAFIVLALVGTAADLWTKHWVFQWRGLPGQLPVWWIWEPYVGIETTVNTGAVFGVGAGNGFRFALLSIGAIVGIVYWLFVRRAAHHRWLTWTLGIVMGGILGNLYDRLGMWYQPGLPLEWRHGVRDWILFRYGAYTWPNFNIADSLLVCGACLLIWRAFREPAEQSVDEAARMPADAGSAGPRAHSTPCADLTAAASRPGLRT